MFLLLTQIRNVTVTYQRGLPNITLPLPSRKERCVFTLKPITCTVGDFLDMIKFEDRGVDRAIVTTIDGTRIGSSNTIENLLQDDFKLIINDAEYTVQPPIYQKHTMEDMQKLSDVQILVGQLYETLQVREYHADMERQVLAELEAIKLELEPYEEKLQELENAAMRRANLNAWIWLVLMSMHAGGFARLTWWEYSWDIMEPVTYFVTYGTAVGWFIYFLLTQQEYVLQDVVNRRRLIELHKRAKQIGLDLNAYNRLKDRAYELEGTLKVIRGPLYERKLEMRQKRERYTSSSSRSPSSSPSPSPSPDRDVAKTSIPAKIDKRETSKTLEYDKFR
ncbi:hypothetical protein V1478_014282 [Vespula squamosa]|uniref:Calcium uniporter protein n=1 Tax=Vespula squamosa TaxID=30214 RepID=A0ABD2A7P1_VESSQ